MDIQVPQIIYYLINFGVVVGLLTYLLYKPVMSMLDERSRKIEEGQKAAEKSIKDSQTAQESKAKLLKDAEQEAAHKTAEIVKKAQQQAREIIDKAKEDAASEAERSRQESLGEKADLIKRMHKEFESQVIKTVEKVTGATLDKSTASKLIDDDLSALVKRI